MWAIIIYRSILWCNECFAIQVSLLPHKLLIRLDYWQRASSSGGQKHFTHTPPYLPTSQAPLCLLLIGLHIKKQFCNPVTSCLNLVVYITGKLPNVSIYWLHIAIFQICFPKSGLSQNCSQTILSYLPLICRGLQHTFTQMNWCRLEKCVNIWL